MTRDVTPRLADPVMHHYECAACGYRANSESRLLACPNCGSTLTNISVPRE